MFWRSIPTCLLYCIAEELDCCFSIFFGFKEMFEVNSIDESFEVIPNGVRIA
jgi:hypothetical protein